MKTLAKKIVAWLATTKFLAFPRAKVRRIILYAISSVNGDVFFFHTPERLKVIALIKKIKNERELLLHDVEAYNVYMAAKRTAKIEGDIAEVGVYKGGSARLICEAKGNKTLHLFDTFAGLPALCAIDNPEQLYKGEFLCSIDDVKAYLKQYPNVYFYKGLFPSTADPVKNKRFSFVNLDVDLYESTVSCLDFFYSRMNTGGVIISHDYIDAPGVRKAFDDFFKDKPEPILELIGGQCLVVKC